MTDLRERFSLVDDLDPPELWREAVARADRIDGVTTGTVSHRNTRKRLIAAAAALLVFLPAAVFAWRAFREESPPQPRSSASPTLVPSGGTYRFTDVRVVFPAEPRRFEDTPVAEVSYTVEWTTPSAPGEATCTFRLLDDEGNIIRSEEWGFATLLPTTDTSVRFPARGAADPVAAEIDCGPGMVFVGSSYVFENVRVEGDKVLADVSWSGGTPVGHAACALRVGSAGDDRISTNVLSVGPGDDTPVGRLGSPYPDGTPVEIRCEPYRSPAQRDPAYWLPWDDAVAPQTSETADLVEVDPMPSSILEAGQPWDEINRRTAAWVASIDADRWSTAELAAAMDRITSAIVNRPAGDDRWWLRVQELGQRRSYLCGLLPSDHPYRGGEYCA